jgi:hypothetical protein
MFELKHNIYKITNHHKYQWRFRSTWHASYWSWHSPEFTSLFLSQMNKCCYGVITLWHCLAGSRSGWGPNFSRRLCSCDINTLGSPTIPSSAIGLSTSLSTCELGLTTSNVSDGVYCLSFKNYVPRKSKALPSVDINVLSKILILKIKHVFILFLSKPTIFFYKRTKKSQGFNKV